MASFDGASTPEAQVKATHCSNNPRRRKNVREESAGFTLSLDDLLTDACEVVDNAKYDLRLTEGSVTGSPKTVVSSSAVAGVLHTNAHILPSASLGTKRESHEAFDHAAVADFLSYGAWNDLLPRDGDGSSAVVLSDSTLHTAAATLGFSRTPLVPSGSARATSSSRPRKVCDTRLPTTSNEFSAPTTVQAARKRARVHAQCDDVECDDSDAGSTANSQTAGSWNDLAPQPADTSENTQAAQRISADLPLNPTLASVLRPFATPVSKNFDRGILAASNSSTAGAVHDAASSELGCLTSHAGNDAETNKEGTITGLAPAHLKFCDASSNLDGSSDCIAFALAGVLA